MGGGEWNKGVGGWRYGEGMEMVVVVSGTGGEEGVGWGGTGAGDGGKCESLTDTNQLWI